MRIPVHRGQQPCLRLKPIWFLVILPLVAYLQVYEIKSIKGLTSSQLNQPANAFFPFQEGHQEQLVTTSIQTELHVSHTTHPTSATVNTSSMLFNAECFLMDDGEQPKKVEKADQHPKLDKLTLGRCRHLYPTRVPPKGGYTKNIDYFHLRDKHKERDQCLFYCIDQLDKDEINVVLLVQAVKMGLTEVVRKLKVKYGLDPLYCPSLGPDYGNKPGFNAVQEAIRGGHYEALQVLTNGNNGLVIDSLGRTVTDYIQMKGSPIRPMDAKEHLSLDTTTDQQGSNVPVDRGPAMGWNESSNIKVDERCDIDVINGGLTRAGFYNDYFTTGRPFVLRGMTPKSEIQAFSKDRWSSTKHFHPSVPVRVGPTAYPTMTNQQYCKPDMPIAMIENATECQEMPGVPMVHARHPSKGDLKELYPMYDGDLYHHQGGWRKLKEFFGPKPWEYNLGWQVFFGGDGSGATFHWHNAAFNILYSGIKQWKITPPRYRGFTGMPAMTASQKLDNDLALHCTQQPGDMMFIPDYWGHLTVNSGFTIGAAVILSTDFQMMADAKPKILFVHINKNGGTSVIQMLQNRCQSQYMSERWGGGHRTFHATAHSLIDHYGQEVWNDAYTFAVVRHPLARQVSNFFFLLDRCSRKYSELCEGRMIPKGLDLKTDEDKIEAFHEHIRNLFNEYPPGSKKHYLFGGWGHGNEEFKTMNATQTSWLVDSTGSIVVKKILKLENLSRDMNELGKSMPCLKNKQANKASSHQVTKKVDSKEKDDLDPLVMVHVNASPMYPDYRLFGNNRHTNRIMKEVYAEDYKNFGYVL